MRTQFEQELINRAKELMRKPKILFPETMDLRILQAIERIIKEDIVIPVVIEPPNVIQERYPKIQQEELHYIRLHHKEINDKPYPYLDWAADLLNEGKVDGVIVGAITPSAHVFRTALTKIGKALGCNTISGAMFIIPESKREEKEKIYLFSDVAVTIEPSQHQLVDIALASIETWNKITNIKPSVAMLSFSTFGSAIHSSIDLAVNAIKDIKSQCPAIDILGEIQFDAAIDSKVALTKGTSLPQGGANVLIFPNLASANIGYKIAQKFGNAKTIAVTQGLKKPFFDLSRGSSVDEIVGTCALIAIYASPKDKGV